MMARGDYVRTYAGAVRQAGAELMQRAARGQSAGELAAYLAERFPSLPGQILGALATNTFTQQRAELRAFAAGRVPQVAGWAREVRELPRDYRYVVQTLTPDPETGRKIPLTHVFDTNLELSSAELRELALKDVEMLGVGRLRYEREMSKESMRAEPEFRVLAVQEASPRPAA